VLCYFVFKPDSLEKGEQYEPIVNDSANQFVDEITRFRIRLADTVSILASPGTLWVLERHCIRVDLLLPDVICSCRGI